MGEYAIIPSTVSGSLAQIYSALKPYGVIEFDNNSDFSSPTSRVYMTSLVNQKFARVTGELYKQFYPSITPETNSYWGLTFVTDFDSAITRTVKEYNNSYNTGTYRANSTTYNYNGSEYLYIGMGNSGSASNPYFQYTGIYNMTPIDSIAELFATLNPSPYITGYTITYRDTNCTHDGPEQAAPNETVTVNYTFPTGYGFVNSSDIYVTNNGVVIPSQYSNGALVFTMPGN